MSCEFRFRIWLKRSAVALLLSTLHHPLSTALAFEGRIDAVMTRGSQADALLYTVGTNSLRVEMTATNWPNPVDLLDRNSGELTLLFPNNRSFVRLKAVAPNADARPPGFPAMPPGVGPQSSSPVAPSVIGPTNLPGMPAPPPMPAMPALPNLPAAGGMPAMPNLPAGGGMPVMPMMPPPMMEPMELKATGEKTNLLGFACEKFQIKQRGETMEIWATAQLFPFQPYLQNQPPRFGPRMIEEQWGGLLQAKKLFPLLAILKFENGPERYRFEVRKTLTEKLTDDDAKLFLPPDGYVEIQALPF